METPLTARDFLLRFHLPQLVRIANVPESKQNSDQSPSNTITQQRQQQNVDNTTLLSSSSRREKRSKWTYLEPQFIEPNGSSSQPSHLDRSPASFWDASSDGNLEQHQQQQHHHMMSLTVELPRASLSRNKNHRQASLCNLNKPNTIKSNEKINHANVSESDAGASYIRLCPPSKQPLFSKLALNQPFLLYKARRKVEMSAYVLDRRNELDQRSGQPIYFPLEYSGWFSLVNDRAKSQGANSPLEFVGQVCETGAQVFLTRDQIAAYRLPSKLSQSTKVKNSNQLLALPLAINLASPTVSTSPNHHSDSTTRDILHNQQHQSHAKIGGSSSSKNLISDLVPTTIDCGQVLMICGVYEDVLPLINERSQQQSHINQSHIQYYKQQQLHQMQAASRPHQAFDLSPLASALYDRHVQAHQQQHQPSLSHINNIDKVGERKSKRRLWKKQQTTSNTASADNGNSIVDRNLQEFGQYPLSPPLIYSGNLVQAQQSVASQQHPIAIQGPVFGRRHGGVAGQRYARCIVLSEQSVDKLTGTICEPPTIGSTHNTVNQETSIGRNKPLSDKQKHQKSDEAQIEPEVLIPLDQRGRFYICATNQSILEELYNFTARPATVAAAAGPKNESLHNEQAISRVYRLSQIVYQLNMFKKLSTRQHDYHHVRSNQVADSRLTCCNPEPARANLMKLPLSVQLICGPRPANFSPTIFGASSTMESYFELEENVAGHKLDCHHNLNNIFQSHQANGMQRQTRCDCATKLILGASQDGEPLGMFSVRLQFERLQKRDVILACTIKPDPLERLEQHVAPPGGNGLDSVYSNCANNDEVSIYANDDYHRQQYHDDLKNDGKLVGKSRKVLKQGATIGARHSSSMSFQFGDNFDPATPDGASAEQIRNHKNLSKTLSGKCSLSRLQACRSLMNLNGRNKKERPKIPTSMMRNEEDAAVARNSQININPNSLGFQGQLQAASGTDSKIVLIEFDCCDNADLRFSRTFVEPSIPTATIPELVLARVKYTQLHSACWERQLKLSYKSLADDFEICEQQMRQQSRVKDYAIARHETPSSLMQKAKTSSLSSRSENDMILVHESLAQTHSQTKERSNVNAEFELSKSCSPSESSVDSSTQSSRRSSSGVSSSGEPHSSSGHQITGASSANIPSNRDKSSSKSKAAGGRANDELIDRRLQDETKVANSSRLLRLVQRVLPGKMRSAHSKLVEAPPLEARAQHDESKSDVRVECDANAHGTLMNAQKIHKMLQKTTSNDEGGDVNMNCDYNLDDKAHLYERLEHETRTSLRNQTDQLMVNQDVDWLSMRSWHQKPATQQQHYDGSNVYMENSFGNHHSSSIMVEGQRDVGIYSARSAFGNLSRRHNKRRPIELQARVASSGSSSGLARDQMEPVSIEICCHDQFDSKVESNDERESEHGDDEAADFGWPPAPLEKHGLSDDEDQWGSARHERCHYAAPSPKQQQQQQRQCQQTKLRAMAAKHAVRTHLSAAGGGDDDDDECVDNNDRHDWAPSVELENAAQANAGASLHEIPALERPQDNNRNFDAEQDKLAVSSRRRDGEEVIYANLMGRGRAKLTDRMERRVMQIRQAQRAKRRDEAAAMATIGQSAGVNRRQNHEFELERAENPEGVARSSDSEVERASLNGELRHANDSYKSLPVQALVRMGATLEGPT